MLNDYITVENLACGAGILLFGAWLLRTSLGRNALSDCPSRRNNMPFYLPFVPLFVWFVGVSLAVSLTRKLLGNLQGWQGAFVDNLVLGIGAVVTIVVIVFLARASFARGLKGFGLNPRRIHRDFFAALVLLLAVWPLLLAAIILTTYLGRLIWGPQYQIEQHTQLELITSHSQLPLRILVIVVATVCAPLLEEMLFRGLFQTMVRSYLAGRLIRQTDGGLTAEHAGNAERKTPSQTTDFTDSTDLLSSSVNPCKSVSKKSSATPASAGASLSPRKRGAVENTWQAIAISSIVFATAHQNPAHWPALLLLGACLGYAYEKTGSLFRAIFIHALFNALTITAVLYG
jgi:membrane protease YdiL (CAAX protease family)